jgi:hypothetical protein
MLCSSAELFEKTYTLEKNIRTENFSGVTSPMDEIYRYIDETPLTASLCVRSRQMVNRSIEGTVPAVRAPENPEKLEKITPRPGFVALP